MLEVLPDNTIKLTRGDTAYIDVPIITEDTGEVYQLQPNDELTLGLKRNVKEKVCCLQKTIKGSNVFKIVPEDTSGLDFGTYKYDVQLTTTDGDVFTVVNNAIFMVKPEVV